LKEYRFCNINIFLLHNCRGERIGDVLGEPAAELMGAELLIMFVLIV
jgi:hypothetical protein